MFYWKTYLFSFWNAYTRGFQYSLNLSSNIFKPDNTLGAGNEGGSRIFLKGGGCSLSWLYFATIRSRKGRAAAPKMYKNDLFDIFPHLIGRVTTQHSSKSANGGCLCKRTYLYLCSCLCCFLPSWHPRLFLSRCDLWPTNCALSRYHQRPWPRLCPWPFVHSYFDLF